MRDYVKIAREYRDAARRDKQGKKFCKWVRLAAERAFRDQQRARTDKRWHYYFEPRWANDVCGFIEKLPYVEGEWGSPTIELQDWDIFILCEVFGWRRRTGKQKNIRDPRRFNTAYVEVGRGNAKSTKTAGIGLYGLTCEGEVGPKIYCAATTGSQARIVFGIAQRMVEKTPALREAFGVAAMANSIPCWRNGGQMVPINSKASTQDGLSPHMVLDDELHAQRDRALFDVLKSARGKRKNPLSWYITTAGYNLAGVCYEQRSLVTKILEGIVPEDEYFGIIYTLDEGDDPFDPKVWIKANPNLGVSVDPKELEQYAREAKASPQSEGEFKTKRCNLWLNAANAWLNMHQWDACGDSGLKIEQFYGRKAWICDDLSANRDVSAAVLLTLTDEGCPIWFSKFYLPKENVLELAHSKHAHYAAWAKEGLFTLTGGNFIDYDRIQADNEEWCQLFNVQEIAGDQYGFPQLSVKLEAKGYMVTMVPYYAKNVARAAIDLEGRVQSGLCRHDNNPVMKWMASNCVVDRRVDGSILPKKESKESVNKIDGIAALLIGWGRMLEAVEKNITQGYVRL